MYVRLKFHFNTNTHVTGLNSAWPIQVGPKIKKCLFPITMLKKLGRIGRIFLLLFARKSCRWYFGKYPFACSRIKLGLKLEDYRCSKMHSQPYLRPK